jgi:hypothetical protein
MNFVIRFLWAFSPLRLSYLPPFLVKFQCVECYVKSKTIALFLGDKLGRIPLDTTSGMDTAGTSDSHAATLWGLHIEHQTELKHCATPFASCCEHWNFVTPKPQLEPSPCYWRNNLLVCASERAGCTSWGWASVTLATEGESHNSNKTFVSYRTTHDEANDVG